MKFIILCFLSLLAFETTLYCQPAIKEKVEVAYGFNHLEASRSFNEAADIDSNCAMAYWGMAMGAPGMAAPSMYAHGITPGSTPASAIQILGSSTASAGKQLSFEEDVMVLPTSSEEQKKKKKVSKDKKKKAKRARKIAKHVTAFKNDMYVAVVKA